MAEGKITRRGGGVNVKDATATENDVLQGETFYSIDKDKKTGNIPSKGAQTFTPGTSNQTINSGQYLSGTQTILGDSDLVPSNIRDGTTIFGVTGTLIPPQFYLSFDGVDDYVELPFNPSFIYENGIFEVEIDFLIKNHATSVGTWNTLYNIDQARPFRIIVDNNEKVIVSIGNNSETVSLSSSNINENEIYNVKVVGNGTSFELFLNNVSQDSSTFNYGLLSNSYNDSFLGKWRDNERYLDGNIYYFRINDNNSFLEYDFTEGSGTTLGDSIGNNDGTIYGATWEQE